MLMLGAETGDVDVFEEQVVINVSSDWVQKSSRLCPQLMVHLQLQSLSADLPAWDSLVTWTDQCSHRHPDTSWLSAPLS